MDIAKHIKNKTKYEIVEDRKEAIKQAILNAKQGDIVVLLAKGGEHYMQINNESVKYEGDLNIAKKVLKNKGTKKKKPSYC